MKLILGPLGGDVVAELPFILMHPKPDEPKTSETVTNNSKKTEDNSNTNNGHLIQLEYVYTIVSFLDFWLQKKSLIFINFFPSKSTEKRKTMMI